MSARVYRVDESAPDKNSIIDAVNALKAGKLVVFPTETVYGIGADAFDESAVNSLYEKKQRSYDKPLLMHISSLEMAQSIAFLDESAIELIRRFTPGPLTLVVKRRDSLPSVAVSGGDTVGLRFPSNNVFLEISKAFGAPIAATSANISGQESAKSSADLSPVMDIADVVIDSGICEYGLESTIVSLVGDRPKILRQGSFPRELIEEVLGICD